ncbi:MAG TPA: DUF1800 domain-containing protein [Marmoricola sp.]|nr:DUF1800 domain-containing protein [Marmoricola sp.]
MASTSLAARVLTRSAARRRAYRPRRYDATPVPTDRELHVLNRLGCGFSTGSYKQLRRAGGAMEWFEVQLDHESVPENARAAGLAGWFPRLWDDPATKMASDRADRYKNHEYGRDLSNYSLLRRSYSDRTVFESMVELWSNHLHVEARHFPGFTQRALYDQTIRAHALGTFADLLVAASLHPAMLLYLDNWRSKADSPNENHGRELLELHTVGRDARYTEAMVKDSAKILSGWTVIEGEGYRAEFQASRHATGSVKVLGFSHRNTVADNPGLAERYLRYLAAHPSTAERICRKLAVRFVSDEPSAGLVDQMAAAYLANDTDIKATLRAMVSSDEFWGSAGQKVRTAIDDVVATCRVLQIKANAPTREKSFGNVISHAIDDTLIYHWPRPDGPPDRAAVSASTTRMLNSWRMHWQLGGGFWPDGDVAYRSPLKFLPVPGMRFDELVDHLCRVLIGRQSTPKLLEAACKGCDVLPGERITRGHAVMRHKFPRLTSAVLDTTEHMTR